MCSLESGPGARFFYTPCLDKKNPHQLYGGAHVLQAWTWALRAYEGVHATSCWLRDVRAGQLDRQCRVMLLIECSEKLVASDNSDRYHEKTPPSSRVLLREDAEHNVCIAATIDALLDVGKNSKAWPLIPLEELHASSIQHSARLDYRWLLNTRRVPMRGRANIAPSTSSSDDAAEHATAASSHEPQLPPCVAYPETPARRPTRAIPFLCPEEVELGRLLSSTIPRFLHRD